MSGLKNDFFGVPLGTIHLCIIMFDTVWYAHDYSHWQWNMP